MRQRKDYTTNILKASILSLKYKKNLKKISTAFLTGFAALNQLKNMLTNRNL
ncbi:MAG: hypothetical protein JWQ30_1230 [Sediminibacterium sp.]|nr:hypothetical protein [Sediminibacterium sp.]